MCLRPESEADRALVDGFDGVLDLVQSALRTPHGDIGVVLVAEHGEPDDLQCKGREEEGGRGWRI